MNLIISYRNNKSDFFEEKHLDCHKLTMQGHASELIRAWEKQRNGIHQIDFYNAVLLDEIISVRVV